MTDVLTFGEAMASLRGNEGALRLGGTFDLTIGGAEANLAIGLARLGHRVSWAGRVGADETGALVLRTLRAEGVHTHQVTIDPAAATGLMLLERRTADLVRVEYHRQRSAATSLREDTIDSALAEQARVLHVTGITAALSETAAAAVGHAARHADGAGWMVCLDVNYRARLWSTGDAAATLRPLLPYVDVLVASADELPIVTDATDDPAGALLAGGVREVVVTRGIGGAEVRTAAGSVSRAADRVTLVDPIGAGDAFVAGYLSALLDGLDVVGRLARGTAVAGFAVATHGDWEGLPTRAELALAGHGDGTVR